MLIMIISMLIMIISMLIMIVIMLIMIISMLKTTLERLKTTAGGVNGVQRRGDLGQGFRMYFFQYPHFLKTRKF
ncbi:MAG: hypothetical protein LBI86_04165 [Treponema sp.]|nr:hypothetical protein [Treponema sp.]